jgi:hypothetical protein
MSNDGVKQCWVQGRWYFVVFHYVVVLLKLEKCGYFELMESKKFNIFHEDINKIYKKGINFF